MAVVYENRGGGGGLIAGETEAKAAPDGYTLLVGSGNTHTFPKLLYEKVPYDPVKDYSPITNFVLAPNLRVATPSFPPKTIQELGPTERPLSSGSPRHPDEHGERDHGHRHHEEDDACDAVAAPMRFLAGRERPRSIDVGHGAFLRKCRGHVNVAVV